MRHVKKKCGCDLYSYTIEELLSGKVKHPQNSKHCDKHKQEMIERCGLTRKPAGTGGA